jgi:formaldehyde-activating enzyme involved in methanogenesis
MKKDFYQELFQQEYNAHKYTISKNMELKNTVNRLLEINDKLLKSIQSFDSDKSILINEIIRLKKLVKEEDYDKR